MVSIDLDMMEEFRQRLKERYTAVELVEILDISIDEILDVFENNWQENTFLLEECGFLKDN